MRLASTLYKRQKATPHHHLLQVRRHSHRRQPFRLRDDRACSPPRRRQDPAFDAAPRHRVEASLPPSSLGGSSVYVDAEGSFSPTRSDEIAESLVRLAKAMQEKRGAVGAMTEPRRLPTSLTGAASQRSERDIHVFRVHDEASNERHSAVPVLALQPPMQPVARVHLCVP